MAWSIDRLGHDLKDLLYFLDALKARAVISQSLQKRCVDAATETSGMVFQLSSMLADQARSRKSGQRPKLTDEGLQLVAERMRE